MGIRVCHRASRRAPEDLGLIMKTDCSWKRNGVRVFGRFIGWSRNGQFAVVHMGHGKYRVPKADLTFEVG